MPWHNDWWAQFPHLHNSSRSLLSHVVNGILVSKPIRSLHCVIEMPPPVILLHVPQSCIDPTLFTRATLDKSILCNNLRQREAGTQAMMYLCSDSVRPRGEELCDAGSVEASLWQAKGCSESCSSSSYYYSIKLMIHNWVLCRDLKTIKDLSVWARPVHIIEQ